MRLIDAELKPCPFCGRIPKIEEGLGYFVICECGIEQSELYKQKCDAVKHWNERKDEPQYDFGEYADRLWKIAYERGKREALEQTEPSCDTCKLKDTTEWCKRQEVCRAYQPKDEPQTNCGGLADRLAYERGVKHAWEVAQKVFDSTVTFYEAEDVAKQIDKDINVRSKDEPQTDCLTCRYNSDEWDSPKCDGCSKAHSNYEPQTDCAWKKGE